MKVYGDIFENVIAPQNLFLAWDTFKKGKRNKPDVARFEMNLEQHIFAIHHKLAHKSYRHGLYTAFYINDPKQRHIHKASVKDRIVHHALYRVLAPMFEPMFIHNSYSCRIDKGHHAGVNALYTALRKVSSNNHIPCFALKCDIKKFFDSVDHGVLREIIAKKIADPDALWLIDEIIRSFTPGLPIGNLTSQLFANIYMNELDHFAKHTLRIPFYIRYTDDFVMVSNSQEQLWGWLESIRRFLNQRLHLTLHPRKVIMRKYIQGIDFLGYVQLPDHRVVRTKTKRRIFKKIRLGATEQVLQSYLGVLSHANSFVLSEKLKNEFWIHRVDKK